MRLSSTESCPDCGAPYQLKVLDPRGSSKRKRICGRSTAIRRRLASSSIWQQIPIKSGGSLTRER